jgi:hypothetical protein
MQNLHDEYDNPDGLCQETLTVLAHMMGHVRKHPADVLVGELIEDVLGETIAAHETGSAQQPQMVTDKRLRQLKALGDITDGSGRFEAIEKDAQTGRVAKQPECFSKACGVGVGWHC